MFMTQRLNDDVSSVPVKHRRYELHNSDVRTLKLWRTGWIFGRILRPNTAIKNPATARKLNWDLKERAR